MQTMHLVPAYIYMMPVFVPVMYVCSLTMLVIRTETWVDILPEEMPLAVAGNVENEDDDKTMLVPARLQEVGTLNAHSRACAWGGA